MTYSTVPADPAHRPVALVTGGSRGIGRAIVEVLAPTHTVLVGGRDAARVGQVVRSLPWGRPFVADLADEDATVTAANGVGPLDVLVHCAGIIPPAGATLRAQWREVLEVNVIGVAHLTQLLLPALRERRGLVVFVNSGAGLRAMGDIGGYSASKFALTSFADGLREAERGSVRVASIHPGRVDTAMQRDLQARNGRPYHAGEHLSVAAVAAGVRAIIEAPSAAVIESLTIRPAGSA